MLKSPTNPSVGRGERNKTHQKMTMMMMMMRLRKGKLAAEQPKMSGTAELLRHIVSKTGTWDLGHQLVDRMIRSKVPI